LYRLLAGQPAEQLGARVIALATTVLARDLIEARALRAELDRVRAERASLRDLPDEGLRTGQPRPAETDRPRRSFLQPVAGSLLMPFGVARDPGTGAWIFRAAATYAAHPGETVSSPTAARVMRVASSVAGGAAVVLAEEPGSGWTSVVSGLASVAVAPGELVGRGDPLGRVDEGAPGAVRVEICRGRTPIDPASVLRGK
jgi:septal ring factor EnvC (AmiA/AmiB activator)